MVDTDMTDMLMATSASIWSESSGPDQEMSEISPRKPSQVTEKYLKNITGPRNQSSRQEGLSNGRVVGQGLVARKGM